MFLHSLKDCPDDLWCKNHGEKTWKVLKSLSEACGDSLLEAYLGPSWDEKTQLWDEKVPSFWLKVTCEWNEKQVGKIDLIREQVHIWQSKSGKKCTFQQIEHKEKQWIKDTIIITSILNGLLGKTKQQVLETLYSNSIQAVLLQEDDISYSVSATLCPSRTLLSFQDDKLKEFSLG